MLRSQRKLRTYIRTVTSVIVKGRRIIHLGTSGSHVGPDFGDRVPRDESLGLVDICAYCELFKQQLCISCNERVLVHWTPWLQCFISLLFKCVLPNLSHIPSLRFGASQALAISVCATLSKVVTVLVSLSTAARMG